MNLERIYEYRFKDVNVQEKVRVWNIIGLWLYRKLGMPANILEVGAGSCEFLNSLPKTCERWAVDLQDIRKYADPGIKCVKGELVDVELPKGHFKAVLLSNFLEHLPTNDHIYQNLRVIWESLEKGGKILIVGPNFKYCKDQYFDCADHNIALTEVSIAEHIYAAGFTLEKIVPRFLPYSFRSRFPKADFLVSTYLNFPFLWRIFGKQFLVIGKKVE